jgi:hypothetical protein
MDTEATRGRRSILAGLGSVALGVAGCLGRDGADAERTGAGGQTPSGTAAPSPTSSTPEVVGETDDGLPIVDDVPLRYLYGDVAPDGSIPSGPDTEPFHQMRLSDDGRRGLSGFRSALEEVGFRPTEVYDAEATLTGESLSDLGVLILGSNQHRFEEAEAAALGEWVENGGGVIAYSDSAFGGDYRQVGVCNPAGRLSENDLTAQFGMRFLMDNGAGRFEVSEYERAHFLNAGDADGGVVYRGEGVSPIRVSEPARVLAPLQSGDLNGSLKVCEDDRPFQPERDAALAVAEVGAGRVVGTFDRNTFWNGGAGTELGEVDNREFAQRLALWAAGVG